MFYIQEKYRFQFTASNKRKDGKFRRSRRLARKGSGGQRMDYFACSGAGERSVLWSINVWICCGCQTRHSHIVQDRNANRRITAWRLIARSGDAGALATSISPHID